MALSLSRSPVSTKQRLTITSVLGKTQYPGSFFQYFYQLFWRIRTQNTRNMYLDAVFRSTLDTISTYRTPSIIGPHPTKVLCPCRAPPYLDTASTPSSKACIQSAPPRLTIPGAEGANPALLGVNPASSDLAVASALSAIACRLLAAADSRME